MDSQAGKQSAQFILNTLFEAPHSLAVLALPKLARKHLALTTKSHDYATGLVRTLLVAVNGPDTLVSLHAWPQQN